MKSRATSSGVLLMARSTPSKTGPCNSSTMISLPGKGKLPARRTARGHELDLLEGELAALRATRRMMVPTAPVAPTTATQSNTDESPMMWKLQWSRRLSRQADRRPTLPPNLAPIIARSARVSTANRHVERKKKPPLRPKPRGGSVSPCDVSVSGATPETGEARLLRPPLARSGRLKPKATAVIWPAVNVTSACPPAAGRCGPPAALMTYL